MNHFQNMCSIAIYCISFHCKDFWLIFETELQKMKLLKVLKVSHIMLNDINLWTYLLVTYYPSEHMYSDEDI